MTYEELKELFIAFVKEHGKSAAIPVLKKFGVEKLYDLKASDMGRFVEELDAAHNAFKPKSISVEVTIRGPQGAGKTTLRDFLIETLNETVERFLIKSPARKVEVKFTEEQSRAKSETINASFRRGVIRRGSNNEGGSGDEFSGMVQMGALPHTRAPDETSEEVRCPTCGCPTKSIFDHLDGCPPEPEGGYTASTLIVRGRT